MTFPLAIHFPFMDQSFVILVIGLLLFGKRLPEVGRSIGKGIVEFKKGLKGIEDDIETASSQPAAKPVTPVLPVTATAATPAVAAEHKFDPMTGKPIEPPPAPRFDPYTGKPIGAADSTLESPATA